MKEDEYISQPKSQCLSFISTEDKHKNLFKMFKLAFVACILAFAVAKPSAPLAYSAIWDHPVADVAPIHAPIVAPIATPIAAPIATYSHAPITTYSHAPITYSHAAPLAYSSLAYSHPIVAPTIYKSYGYAGLDHSYLY